MSSPDPPPDPEPSDPEPGGDPDSDPECSDPWSDPDTALFLTRFSFWFGGVLYCCIGILGLAGNAAAVRIFTLRDMRSNFHAYLVALSAIDILLLFVSVLTEALELDPRNLDNPMHHYPARPAFVYLFPTFLYPLGQIFTTASIYMTVALSINRYLVILHPFDYMSPRKCPTPAIDGKRESVASGCECDMSMTSMSASAVGGGSSLSNGELKRLLLSVAAVAAFSIVYSIPHFMEYRVGRDNATGELRVEWTELRENKLYTELYTIGCDLVLRLVVPVAIILFTGVKIVLVLRKYCDWKTKTEGRGGKGFVRTFAGVVVLFVLSQSAKLVNNLYNLAYHDQQTECQQGGEARSSSAGFPTAGYVIEDIARVALLLNSSVSFVVYFSTSESFRQHVRKGYCLRRHPDGRRKRSDLVGNQKKEKAEKNKRTRNKFSRSRGSRASASASTSASAERSGGSLPAGVWYIIFESQSVQTKCYF